MRVRSLINLCSVVACVAASAACSDDESDTPDVMMLADEARLTYADIVQASYGDTLQAAMSLDGALQDLITTPSEATMTAARAAWRDAREPYLQTEVFRFYSGPIDNEDDGPEGLLNAWPLDEVYIDYVDGDANAGIVNDTQTTIDEDTLTGLNEAGGEKNIATGYHAIEFLLWGQDFNDDGPGDRPFTDYVTDGSGTAANQDRRAEYLSTVSQLLIDDLTGLVDAWAEDQDNYHQQFVSVPPFEALSRIMTGMAILSGFETGGERLQTALISQDQEDEHSCFSDNTHRDMVQDVRGIRNVWRGSYTRLDGGAVTGTAIRDVVEAMDADLAASLDTQIDESFNLAEDLVPPFDQEIAAGNTAGNARVMDLVLSLQEIRSSVEEVFRLFALTVPANPA